MMKWILDNMEWIFSGVGAVIIGSIIGVIIKENKKYDDSKILININQKSGKKSINIQNNSYNKEEENAKEKNWTKKW